MPVRSRARPQWRVNRSFGPLLSQKRAVFRVDDFEAGQERPRKAAGEIRVLHPQLPGDIGHYVLGRAFLKTDNVRRVESQLQRESRGNLFSGPFEVRLVGGVAG